MKSGVELLRMSAAVSCQSVRKYCSSVLQTAFSPALFTDMPTELGGSGDQVTPGW
jgi:hypothetical protein